MNEKERGFDLGLEGQLKEMKKLCLDKRRFVKTRREMGRTTK